MEKDTKQNNPTSQNFRKQFDQTLGQHIERLIGSRYGVGALPINLATISCIILFAERENYINTFPSSPSERYTHETLLNELAEIGLDPDEDLKMNIHDMIKKGYIDVNDNGKYFAEKPTISMAKLLDRFFPKIPGMNFIAYFVQTMDEAQSGRKDLDSAISQFDQMLKMQGVSLLEQKTNPKPGKALRNPGRRRAKLRKTGAHHISASGSKIISSNRNLGQVEIRRLFAEKDEPAKAPQFTPPAETEGSPTEPEISSDTSPQLFSEPVSDKRNLLGEVVSKDTPLETAPPAREEPLHISEPEEREADLRKELDIEWEEGKSL